MATTSPRQSAPPPIQVGPPRAAAHERSGAADRQYRLPSWALKSAMAVTGLCWAAFVGIHLFGNLKVFQGPEAFNGYAAWLRAAFYPLFPQEMVLWTLRIVLFVSLVVHVGAAVVIWVRARRARGGRRARLRGARSWGAWLMPLTGVALLAFLVFHLLDLTLGIAPAAPEGFVHPGDGVAHAYQNLVASFQRPWSAWGYVVVMLLLSIHIAKGFTTMAVDLGVMGRRLRATLVAVGGFLAVAVLLGNAAIPLFVQAGWLG